MAAREKGTAGVSRMAVSSQTQSVLYEEKKEGKPECDVGGIQEDASLIHHP